MFKIFLLKKRYIFVASFILLCIGCVSNNEEIYIGNKDSGRIENFAEIISEKLILNINQNK